jgi:crossover junction endodeoxyribonuclease RuvC
VSGNRTNIILGIDPGTLVMGYGVICLKDRQMHLMEMGTLRLRHVTNTYEKLRLIYTKVSTLIQEYQPEAFAIEAPFYGKNVQSMLKLGRAQGVAIAAAMQAGLPVCEYSPKKIKQSVTGNGNASKEQIWQMLERQLDFHEKPQYFDATDAVAVAVCHHYQIKTTLVSSQGASKDWKAYIEKHPEKLFKK